MLYLPHGRDDLFLGRVKLQKFLHELCLIYATCLKLFDMLADKLIPMIILNKPKNKYFKLNYTILIHFSIIK